MGEYLKVDIFGIRKLRSNITFNYNFYGFNLKFILQINEIDQAHSI